MNAVLALQGMETRAVRSHVGRDLSSLISNNCCNKTN